MAGDTVEVGEIEVNPDVLAAEASLEPYLRNGHTFWRVRHDVVRSSRLRAFDECVGEATRGRRYRGQGAAVDEAEVRTALTEASQDCAARTLPKA